MSEAIEHAQELGGAHIVVIGERDERGQTEAALDLFLFEPVGLSRGERRRPERTIEIKLSRDGWRIQPPDGEWRCRDTARAPYNAVSFRGSPRKTWCDYGARHPPETDGQRGRRRRSGRSSWNRSGKWFLLKHACGSSPLQPLSRSRIAEPFARHELMVKTECCRNVRDCWTRGPNPWNLFLCRRYRKC